MKLGVEIGSLADFEADAVIVNLFEGIKKPGGGTGAVDKALDGFLTDELTHGKQFSGKLGETLILPTGNNIPARYVILVGLGKQKNFKSTQIRRASAAAIRACQRLKIKNAATLLHGAGIGSINTEVAARLLAEGAIMGNYKFTLRKSKDDDSLKSSLESLTVVEIERNKKTAIQKGLEVGVAIAEAVNQARTWVFDSANYVTPAFLVKESQKIAKTTGITAKILEKAELEKLGMGSYLSVAKGSDVPPKFIHLTYKPSKKAKKKVALVGKGITFDSGGLSLKPAQAMELMKMDMSGAAAVISTMKAISELGDLDVEVHAIAPCCENMPNGNANKPGDIVTAMNGKTIEINNTDAEGRLILADALVYAQQKIQPDEIIDLATLTGACIVALGKEASGIMGTSDKLLDGIRKAGDVAGERYWPLPLFDEFKDMLKSDVADMINAGSKGQAGSSAGGIFLKEFIEEGQAWVHLDVAGPAWTDKDVPEVPKGATGVGVRTLLYYLYGFKEV